MNLSTSAEKTAFENQLAFDEGYRKFPYRCSAGRLTIGYGYNLDAGMPEDEALVLMRYRIIKNYEEIRKRFPAFWSLSLARQHVLQNMAYQVGVEGLFKFTHLIAAVQAEDWDGAVSGMLQSKWARSDSPKRAERLAEMMRNG